MELGSHPVGVPAIPVWEPAEGAKLFRIDFSPVCQTVTCIPGCEFLPGSIYPRWGSEGCSCLYKQLILGGILPHTIVE